MLLHRQKPNQLCYILRYFMYKLYICCCCCGTAQIAESREPPEFNRSWPPTLYYSAKHNLFCINKYTHTRIKSTVLAHDIAWAQSKVAVGTYYCIISQLTYKRRIAPQNCIQWDFIVVVGEGPVRICLIAALDELYKVGV